MDLNIERLDIQSLDTPGLQFLIYSCIVALWFFILSVGFRIYESSRRARFQDDGYEFQHENVSL